MCSNKISRKKNVAKNTQPRRRPTIILNALFSFWQFRVSHLLKGKRFAYLNFNHQKWLLMFTFTHISMNVFPFCVYIRATSCKWFLFSDILFHITFPWINIVWSEQMATISIGEMIISCYNDLWKADPPSSRWIHIRITEKNHFLLPLRLSGITISNRILYLSNHPIESTDPLPIGGIEQFKPSNIIANVFSLYLANSQQQWDERRKHVVSPSNQRGYMRTIVLSRWHFLLIHVP